MERYKFVDLTLEDARELIPSTIALEHCQEGVFPIKQIKIFYTGRAKMWGKIRMNDCILTWHYDPVPKDKAIKERIYRIYKML